MASRALARVAPSRRRLRQGLRPRAGAGARAGDHPLARRDVRSGAGRLLGHDRSRRGDGRLRSTIINAQRRQGRRHQDLAARQGQGDRHAPPAAGGRAHVYRRRLQLCRTDRRRRHRAIRDALLGIFDAIAPAASRGAVGAGRRRRRRDFHDILAPTVPLSRHIFKAPTRFYKTGVVFMAYLNGHQDHFTMVGGQESARSTLHLAEIVPARRRGRAAARPGAGDARACATVLAARGVERLMRDLSSDHRWLSHQHRDGPQAGAISPASSRPARGTASARHRPWRDQVAQVGLERAVKAVRDAGLEAVGLLPRRHVPGRCGAPAARRSTTTAARSTRPRRSARPAWCWWSAACRNIRGRARAVEGHRAPRMRR